MNRSRRWSLVLLVAIIVVAVLVSISLIWGRSPEEAAATLELADEASLLPSPSPSPVPPQRRLVTYTVKSGDTLSAIAQVHDVSIEALSAANSLLDPNVLQIGQVLIIPQGESDDPVDLVAIETPVAGSSAGEVEIPELPTLTPSGPPLVEIEGVVGVGSLDAETVVLRNTGGVTSLEAWALSGSAGDTFLFPALTLFTDGEVRVHSVDGNDTPRDLYWGRGEPAWRAGGLITLRDAEGNVVDTYIVPGS